MKSPGFVDYFHKTKAYFEQKLEGTTPCNTCRGLKELIYIVYCRTKLLMTELGITKNSGKDSTIVNALPSLQANQITHVIISLYPDLEFSSTNNEVFKAGLTFK